MRFSDKESLLNELGRFDPEIRRAFEKVPRERFLPEHLRKWADENQAIPLVEGSSISQPSMIAHMLESMDLRPAMKVLEVGSGCGYVLALLSEMGVSATGVEVIESLANESKTTLESLGYKAKVIEGNAQGLDFDERFDRILFSAAVKDVPVWTFGLLEPGGFVVCPLGREDEQELVLLDSEKIKRTGIFCRFVPFLPKPN